MTRTEYVSLADAAQAIERSGFRLRDAGLLSSALARPSSSFGGVEVYPDLDTKAAALLESLARNHPLFDGNKRTAWVLTQLFFWLNGFRHTFPVEDAFQLVIGVAEGKTSLEESAAALAAHRTARE